MGEIGDKVMGELHFEGFKNYIELRNLLLQIQDTKLIDGDKVILDLYPDEKKFNIIKRKLEGGEK